MFELFNVPLAMQESYLMNVLIPRMQAGNFEKMFAIPVPTASVQAASGYDRLAWYIDYMRVDGQSNVIVLPMSGTMSRYDSWQNGFGSMSLAALIEKAQNVGDVDAIVLNIYSPGGTVDATKTLADAIWNSKKPVLAWSPFVASAAYWAASQADEIWLDNQAASEAGSIGTVIVHQENSRQLEAEGTTTTIIRSGQYKYQPNSIEPLSEEMKADLGAKVLASNKEMKAAVRRGRGGKITTDAVFEGKMYMTSDALSLGLVDKVGSLSQAIQRVLQLK